MPPLEAVAIRAKVRTGITKAVFKKIEKDLL